ncbi:hypothetical protein N1851_030699 [Merluccius polli]|uniref:Uncharacterized protein n=1 Tax=Merluccius polli TaxID=89951 RepID=A0AA47NPW3_MERPO|nr:hypothetical protein N1851_030699 [Merluccius polli]
MEDADAGHVEMDDLKAPAHFYHKSPVQHQQLMRTGEYGVADALQDGSAKVWRSRRAAAAALRAGSHGL